MTRITHCLACLALVAAGPLACRRQGPLPGWIQGAPGGTLFAMSGNLGWMMRQPMFQTTLVQYPMAERILDTFLRQANINVAQETGRVGFFVQGDLQQLVASKNDPRQMGGAFLLSLSEFKDHKALIRALAEAFPPEGSLSLNGREYPLHVVFDFNQWHIRALLDENGTVWLGDLQALSLLGKGRTLPKPVQAAASWITPGSHLQGFVHLTPVLDATRAANAQRQIEMDMIGMLPVGVEAAAFSASPLPGREDAMRFELLVAGTPEGIQKSIPWMQRVLALASSLTGNSGLPRPELVQEKGRMALRCPLSQDHVRQVLSRLNPQGTTPEARAK